MMISQGRYLDPDNRGLPTAQNWYANCYTHMECNRETFGTTLNVDIGEFSGLLSVIILVIY